MALIPDRNDTIVAVATPPGVGALGIVRISGPKALQVVQPYVKRRLDVLPSHTVHLVRLHDPGTDTGAPAAELDEAVLTVFRAPNSYTREDVVELSCHGSPYILSRVVALAVLAGARPAAPGEFTLRAFLAGALDLSQAEAVADLIAARSAQSQQLALRQLRGGYSNRLGQLRDRLLHFAALVELELDFAEEDVEFADRSALDEALGSALHELAALVDSFAAGNALKHGIPTVIAGRPNAGKSTLLNRLLQENRAIVSAIPGTTRDVIEDSLFLGGYEFRLMDTAGIRESGDVIETEGVERTLDRLRQALIVILLYDPAETPPAEADAYAESLPLAEGAHLLRVANKLDLHPADLPTHHLAISGMTGAGVEALRDRLTGIAASLGETDTLVSNQRHAHALRQAHAALQQVRDGLRGRLSGELLALDIRHALHALGEITGEVTSDEILGNIFSRFCIGK